MPAFVPVLKEEELPTEGFKAVEVNGRSILVGRLQGHLFAWLDRCPHAGAPLRIGTRTGTELKCNRHGWVFDLLTGQSLPDDPAFHLMQVPIKLDGGQICIEPPPPLQSQL